MNILLTSAGRRTYLVKFFKEVLKGKGKVFASNSDLTLALNAADDFVITPLIHDKNYIPFLLDYVKANDINVIISVFDIDLPILALSKLSFEKIGVKVIVSDFEVIQTCNDKWESYNFFLKNNLNTPKTYLSVDLALIDLQKGLIGFPLILKPRWGMGSIGIYHAENKLELEVFYNKIKNEIQNSYLIFESQINMEDAVIIQECLDGQEYGLDIFNDLKGSHLKTFVKKKLAMRSGETDSAITEDHKQLQDLGKKLATKLKHIGNLDSDWFVCEKGIYILEMNCRFGGGYPFTHLAGANLPRVLTHLIESNNFDPEDLNMQYGVKMVKDINPVKIKN